MSCKLGHIWKTFKLINTCDESRGNTGITITSKSPKNYFNSHKNIQLVGNTHETNVIVEGISTCGLIDTGSQITTVAHWFYDQHFKDSDMETIEDFLDIKLADGKALPYLGIVLLHLVFPDVGETISFVTPVVIVSDTDFNKHLPVLLGTNVMEAYQLHLKEKFGVNYIQKASVSTPWKLAFQCLNAQARCSQKKIGQLVSHKAITIPPDCCRIVRGSIRTHSPQEKLILTEAETFPQLPVGLVLTPSLHSVDFSVGSIHQLDVEICNFTEHEITLPAKSVLCGVHNAKLYQLAKCNQQQKDSSSTPRLTDEEFIQQFELGTSLSPEEENAVNELLLKWRSVFSCPGEKLGCATGVKHKIKLSDPTPFKEPYRRIPPHLYEEVRTHLKEMLDDEIIRESKSPFSSPIVLVRKPDQTLRFCVDFRRLNAHTIKDAHALPRIDETLDSLVGAHYFSSLDLRSGYWQIELEESDKEKTAFSAGPLGFYEFNRLPFGMVNAPACFQRIMQMSMGDLHLKTCLLYLDDIIVYSKTFKEHLERLESVFQRLKDTNLSLKPSKCHFFQKQVKYLGHLVSKDGIQTDPDKIECLKRWPIPKNVKDLGRFLGFAGFYRRFICGFSKIANPLHDLLKGDIPEKKRKKMHRKEHAIPKFDWNEIHQFAFERLIQLLCDAPVLSFADFTRPFLVHTDASGDGLGAILYQTLDDGKNHPIYYASRGLKPSEKNYPAHKLEFLTLKWSICDKFRDYLYGSSFIVHTDNNPLTYILASAKLDATGQRWASELANYNFTIKYRSGKHNIDADALSRLPSSTEDDTRTTTITKDEVHALCHCQLLHPQFIHHFNLDITTSERMSTSMLQKSADELLEAQMSDKTISPFIKSIKDGKQIHRYLLKDKEIRLLNRFSDHFVLRNNLLHRKRIIDGQEVYQFVVPSDMRNQIIQRLHTDSGHMGRERTRQLVQQRYFWPGLTQDVSSFIAKCLPCLRRKGPTNQTASLVPFSSSQPLELICIDFLGLEKSKGGYEKILVMTDHFTRFAQAVPCKSECARTTAKALFDQFINHYGLPLRIHSDQGRNFESRIIQELCKLLGIQKS